jgi:hypothetical protein
VSFDPAVPSSALQNDSLDDPFTPWYEAVRSNFDRHRVVYWTVVAAFSTLLTIAIARGPAWTAPLLGIGLVVMAAQINGYYYALLLGYGLLAASFQSIGIALLLGSAASLALSEQATGPTELAFVWLSALWVAFAIGATAWVARNAPRAFDPARPA